VITHLLLLTHGEWFKLKRRWLPWILLAVAVLVSQAFLWGFHVVYHMTDGEGTNAFIEDYQYSGETTSIEVTCADMLGGNLEERIQPLSEKERQMVKEEIAEWGAADCSDYVSGDESFFLFVMPGSILGSMVLMFMTGLPFILIMILSASMLGSEYGWGTLRMALSRGMGRWQILSAKLVLCVLIGAGLLVVIALINSVSSVIVNIIPPDEGVSLIVLPEGSTWGSVLSEAGKFFGKAVYATVPYICLGAFFVVLTQSTAQGISLSIVGYIAEAMVVPPLLAISEKLEGIREGLLSSNVSEWMSFGQTEAEVALRGAEQPDTTQAFFVILAYSVVMVGVSLWLFQHRDVSGARGE
jgi:ABC-type transport system involved in multi-copper enzyme maturation permease subunit